jgi:glyoxylase-like metal-dependent hydrolase (beta-lactamase superfamily II)
MAKNATKGNELSKGVYEVYLGHVKSFILVADDGSLILVDAGMSEGDGKKIIGYINSIGKSVKDVKYILLTHSHLDHIGGVAYIQQLSGAKVGIHEDGIRFVNGEAGLRMPVGHDVRGLLMMNFMKVASGLFKLKPFKPEFLLKEGVFPADFHLNAKIIETPGHTSDSISISLADSKTLIVGDLLRGDKNSLIAPAFYEDYLGLLNSVKKVKELSPDLICVSHGKNHPVSAIKVM